MAGGRLDDHHSALRRWRRFACPHRVQLVGLRHRHLSCEQAVAERPDRLARRRDRHDSAGLDHGNAIADLAHHVGRVRHDDDRPALALELVQTVQALLLEALVADGEHLVDEQHVGFDVHGDREAEPDVHARGVETHLVVDELLELRERDDVVEATLDLPARAVPATTRSGRCCPCPTARAGSPRRARASPPDVPRTTIWPEVGCRMPAMHLSSVDLPEPFRPRIPSVSPLRTSNSTSLSAQKSS